MIHYLSCLYLFWGKYMYCKNAVVQNNNQVTDEGTKYCTENSYTNTILSHSMQKSLAE